MEDRMHYPTSNLPIATLRAKSMTNAFGRVEGRIAPIHQGWDIAAFVGTPVYAIMDGRIEFVRDTGNADLGLQVGLRFEHGGRTLFAVYGHLSKADVAPGDAVKEGDRLGRVGQTGNARGQHHKDAHLHFEVRTKPLPGRGLRDRIDPGEILGIGPVNEAILSDVRAAVSEALSGLRK